MNAVPEMITTAPFDRPRGARAALGSNDVHGWLVELDEVSGEFYRRHREVLSADEVARADRFHFDHHRRRFVVARGALRYLLSRFLGVAPEEICFGYGPAGKPFVKVPATDCAVYFNVTHADNLAVIGITRAGEIGIDLECIRELPEWEQVARATFTSEHVEALRACDEAHRPELFFRTWTREEARVKALGVGLGAEGPAREAADLRLQTNSVPPAFLLSFAVPRSARLLPIRRWMGEAMHASVLPSANGAAGGNRSTCC